MKKPPPWIGELRGIAEHQERAVERHQIAAKFGVDHRAFVDHDQFCFRRRRVIPSSKLGCSTPDLRAR